MIPYTSHLVCNAAHSQYVCLTLDVHRHSLAVWLAAWLLYCKQQSCSPACLGMFNNHSCRCQHQNVIEDTCMNDDHEEAEAGQRLTGPRGERYSNNNWLATPCKCMLHESHDDSNVTFRYQPLLGLSFVLCTGKLAVWSPMLELLSLRWSKWLEGHWLQLTCCTLPKCLCP